jgi:hypothetical protein
MYRVASLALPRKAPEGHTLEDRSSEWTPPLQKHYKFDSSQVDHVTLRVRALTGDVESDFIGKFEPGPLFGETVVRFVTEKLGIPVVYRPLFALWIVGRDLGIVSSFVGVVLEPLTNLLNNFIPTLPANQILR